MATETACPECGRSDVRIRPEDGLLSRHRDGMFFEPCPGSRKVPVVREKHKPKSAIGWNLGPNCADLMALGD